MREKQAAAGELRQTLGAIRMVNARGLSGVTVGNPQAQTALTQEESVSKLRPKYTVLKIGSTKAVASADPDDPNSPFVLMPRKDPAAFMAMIAYAQCCEPELARDIKDWLESIAREPVVYGTQGERNRVHMRLTALKALDAWLPRRSA